MFLRSSSKRALKLTVHFDLLSQFWGSRLWRWWWLFNRGWSFYLTLRSAVVFTCKQIIYNKYLFQANISQATFFDILCNCKSFSCVQGHGPVHWIGWAHNDLFWALNTRWFRRWFNNGLIWYFRQWLWAAAGYRNGSITTILGII